VYQNNPKHIKKIKFLKNIIYTTFPNTIL
jgi:hypothetical protein